MFRGVIYVSDPTLSTAYARDAVWSFAHAVHNLIESWEAGNEGDEAIDVLLASSSTLLSELTSVSFYSNETRQDVAFNSDLERQSQLRVYSVGAVNVSYEVGIWKVDTSPGFRASREVAIWPGGTTEQPVGVLECRVSTGQRHYTWMS